MEPLDEPIRKVLVNVYEEDYQEMKRKYGWGWTGIVRDMIRDFLRRRDRENEHD